jgi:hypothetical protein
MPTGWLACFGGLAGASSVIYGSGGWPRFLSSTGALDFGKISWEMATVCTEIFVRSSGFWEFPLVVSSSCGSSHWLAVVHHKFFGV